ncbi:amino acid ABC transporter permease [Cyanobium sp. WAJ14-Wanaka]|uniref:amino acid ABC transporter permease n=1 Tax=Cyanobium sp. WAJ14-Wanaka TaxID=2823725 RepID=UPI0020CBB4DB|nr:amino acid ABC transporter permease [Cyanobium sp. WAJ14-Wanaka]
MQASAPPPMLRPGPWQRLRRELFGSKLDGLISLALFAALLAAGAGLLRWALTQAQWAVIQTNSTLFAVGRYPIEQQWRLWLLTGLLAAAAGLSWGLLRGGPRAQANRWPTNDRLAAGFLVALAALLPLLLQLSLAIQARWWAITGLLLGLRWASGNWASGRRAGERTLLLRLFPLLWPLLYLLGMVLISGGLGLMPVAPSNWGGLLLTLLEASFAILICFPLGLLLALGRRSELPLLSWGSVIYIEFIRGAPLITLLFLGQNILGFLLPGGLAPDRVWRAAWVLTFFAAAYVAEALRSGLNAVPRGQLEAAQALGLSMPQALLQVVIPQAVRVALPSVVGQFITLLQDTTLLSLIGLLDLLGTARTVMANPAFLGRNAEVYLVLAVLFWCCCAALGLGSRALETRLNPNSPLRSAP